MIKMDAIDRRRLFDIYHELDILINEVEEIIRSEGIDYQRAKAYWLSSLSVGLDDSEYCTDNPTFKRFLIEKGIMNEDDDYLEESE